MEEYRATKSDVKKYFASDKLGSGACRILLKRPYAYEDYLKPKTPSRAQVVGSYVDDFICGYDVSNYAVIDFETPAGKTKDFIDHYYFKNNKLLKQEDRIADAVKASELKSPSKMDSLIQLVEKYYTYAEKSILDLTWLTEDEAKQAVNCIDIAQKIKQKEFDKLPYPNTKLYYQLITYADFTKSMSDLVIINYDNKVAIVRVIDFKTTSAKDINQFYQDIEKYDYTGQLAHNLYHVREHLKEELEEFQHVKFETELWVFPKESSEGFIVTTHERWNELTYISIKHKLNKYAKYNRSIHSDTEAKVGYQKYDYLSNESNFGDY